MSSIHKLFFLVLLLPLFHKVSFAQKESTTWYFGSNIGMDFNSGTSQLSTTLLPLANDIAGEGFSTISDNTGNFLFHTNGEHIWDKNLSIMQNGTGLLGNSSSSQCATIFPIPGNSKPSDKAKYMVVTSPESKDYTSGIRYSIINMDTTYVTGAVSNKKNILMNGSPVNMSEALSSCPHFNELEVWVIAHSKRDASELNGNRFYAWKVSPNGAGNIKIAAPVISTIGSPLSASSSSNSAGVAVLKINSCFNTIALSHYDNSIIQVFSFNNKTGVVSAYPDPVNAVLTLDLSKTISEETGDTGSNYGLEFSPNGKYLFATQTGEGSNKKRLYRFDLQAGSSEDIENSRTVVYSDDVDNNNNHRLGHLQLGLDGKIYVTHYYRTAGTGTSRLDVINTPSEASPDYMPSAYTWTSTQRTSMGLPNIHKGFLSGKPAITSALNGLHKVCVGESMNLVAQTAGVINNYKWNIDKNLNSSIDFTTGPTITHTYGTTGNYLVELTVEDLCGFTYVSESTVTVNSFFSPTASITCGNPNSTIEIVSPVAGATYVWYNDADGKNPVGYGTSLTYPKTNTNTFYVKQAVAPSASTVSGSLGTTFVNGSVINTSSGNRLSDTLYIHSPVYLKTAQIELQKGLSDASATKNFTVLLKKETATILTLTPSITVAQNNTANILTVTFNQNLTPGIYTIEVYSTTATGTFQYITAKASLTPSSIAGLAEVTAGPNGSPFYNFTFDYPALAACSKLSDGFFTDCTLPVEFLSISITPERVLTWSTATETNNNYFVIERAYDGYIFKAIGVVKGAGNSLTVKTYSFQDWDNASEEAYYRIKQVDIDEKYSYSSVVYVPKSNRFLVNVYPNPNQGLFTVTLNNNENASIELFNLVGTIVYSTIATKEQNSFTLDFTTISKGTYFLNVTTETQRSVMKVIIE